MQILVSEIEPKYYVRVSLNDFFYYYTVDFGTRSNTSQVAISHSGPGIDENSLDAQQLLLLRPFLSPLSPMYLHHPLSGSLVHMAMPHYPLVSLQQQL